MRKVLVYSIYIVLLFYVAGCSRSESPAAETFTQPVSEEPTIEELTEQPDNDEIISSPFSEPDAEMDSEPVSEPVTEVTYDEDELNDALNTADTIMSAYCGDNYSLSLKDNMLVVNLWQDGIYAGVCAVCDGLRPKSDWDKMVEGMMPLVDALDERFMPYGIDVNFNVLNDTNKEKSLLSFLNGTKVYDVLDE